MKVFGIIECVEESRRKRISSLTFLLLMPAQPTRKAGWLPNPTVAAYVMD
jgi:hypothetical protein